MRFSIVVPVYNVAQYLRASMDSVLKQTYADWEAICVDDGSTDGSSAILDEYARRDSRFRVIHQPNAGVSVARNAGIMAALGQWIVFLDSDDLLKRDCLETFARELERNPAAEMLKMKHLLFDEEEIPSWPEDGSFVAAIEDISSGLSDSMILAAFFDCVYRRDVLPNHLFRPYCTGEDRLFLSECLVRSSKVVLLDYTGYAYRQRLGSAMNSAMTLRKLEHRIGYSHEWLTCLTESGKKISKSIYRLIVNNLTESYVSGIAQLPETDVAKAWILWYKNLEAIAAYGCYFSVWGRFVVAICSCIRLKFLARLLCCVPQKLKKMGIHR